MAGRPLPGPTGAAPSGPASRHTGCLWVLEPRASAQQSRAAGGAAVIKPSPRRPLCLPQPRPGLRPALLPGWPSLSGAKQSVIHVYPGDFKK